MLSSTVRLSESCDKRGKRRGREAARRGVKEWNKPQSRTRGRRDDCREMRGIENNSSDHSAVKRQKKPEDHTNTPKGEMQLCQRTRPRVSREDVCINFQAFQSLYIHVTWVSNMRWFQSFKCNKTLKDK
ncbi:uncharacterized protein ACWYII_006689 isoform 1-T1 [Salvelinus alpinus]